MQIILCQNQITKTYDFHTFIYWCRYVVKENSQEFIIVTLVIQNSM
jgi:hypothetical protein